MDPSELEFFRIPFPRRKTFDCDQYASWTASLRCPNDKFKMYLFHSVLRKRESCSSNDLGSLFWLHSRELDRKAATHYTTCSIPYCRNHRRTVWKSVGQKPSSNLLVLSTAVKKLRKGLINSTQGNAFASALFRNASMCTIITMQIVPELRLSSIGWRCMWSPNGPQLGKIFVYYRWWYEG